MVINQVCCFEVASVLYCFGDASGIAACPCILNANIANVARGLTKKGRRRRPFVTDRERRAECFAI
jgi:hypothetical protein